jgi:hypothetical protein
MEFSMSTRMIGTICLALGLLGELAASAPARADVLYPWCAVYGGGDRGTSATVCSFTSFAQCQATVRGVGGFCQQNPAYPDFRADQPRRRR